MVIKFIYVYHNRKRIFKTISEREFKANIKKCCIPEEISKYLANYTPNSKSQMKERL